MRRIFGRSQDQFLAAVVLALVLTGLAVLIPAVTQRLTARPLATPQPTPTRGPVPLAVLLPEELDRDLQGVMTIVDDQGFGTAFMIDPQGDFLTAASLVSSSQSLRLVDNTGGQHQVRLIAINPSTGVAMVRAGADGIPMAFGDATSLRAADPVMLLASPKVSNLEPATSAVVSALDASRISLRVDDRSGNLGGPIVGRGGSVLGLLIGSDAALPINLVQADIAHWRTLAGTVMPLAPFPPNLLLRGSATSTAPPSGATVESVAPTRASATQDTVITVQGSGFVDGRALRVRFVPVANESGGFDGVGTAIVNGSTLTVKVPAGHLVQDYVIELINGDGTLASSRVAFTITP